MPHTKFHPQETENAEKTSNFRCRHYDCETTFNNNAIWTYLTVKMSVGNGNPISHKARQTEKTACVILTVYTGEGAWGSLAGSAAERRRRASGRVSVPSTTTAASTR